MTTTYNNILPKKAKEIIIKAAKNYSPNTKSYFPAIKQEIILDKGRVGIDLGFVNDHFDFLNELDKEMLGESRIDLSKRERKDRVVGGFNTVYPFYSTYHDPVLVNVWFYTKQNEIMNWHIRGHEEGHIINANVDDLNSLKSKTGMSLKRYDSHALPIFLSEYSRKIRDYSDENYKLAYNQIDDFIDGKDYFKKPFGIVPEKGIEEMILRTAEFFRGAREKRKKDNKLIGNHIKEILDYIEQQRYDDKFKKELRQIALIHDLGKYVTNPNGVSGRLHADISAQMARNLYLSNEVIDIIKVHDYHYYIYLEGRGSKKNINKAKNSKYVKALKGVNMPLLLKFHEADSCNRDKEAIKWFERNMEKLGL